MATDAIFSVLRGLTISRDLIADPNKKNPCQKNNQSGEDEPWKRNRNHGVFEGLEPQ